MSEYHEHADPAPDEFASEPEAGVESEDDGQSQVAVDTVTGDGWEAPSTGVAAVDAVLASVQDLDERPVAEHVAVFEQAHDQLRRALDPGHG